MTLICSMQESKRPETVAPSPRSPWKITRTSSNKDLCQYHHTFCFRLLLPLCTFPLSNAISFSVFQFCCIFHTARLTNTAALIELQQNTAHILLYYPQAFQTLYQHSQRPWITQAAMTYTKTSPPLLLFLTLHEEMQPKVGMLCSFCSVTADPTQN